MNTLPLLVAGLESPAVWRVAFHSWLSVENFVAKDADASRDRGNGNCCTVCYAAATCCTCCGGRHRG